MPNPPVLIKLSQAEIIEDWTNQAQLKDTVQLYCSIKIHNPLAQYKIQILPPLFEEE
jgi:hypothetical protein